MFWKNFYNLCLKKGKAPNKIAKEIGVSSGAITKWKNKGVTPREKTLLKIADYFGVTIDDLLSDKQNYNTFISYSSEERPNIDFRGSERELEKSSSAEEPDRSFDSIQENANQNTTELDEYEKKLIGTFRETTIDGKLRILNAADEIKKDIEKKHNGEDSRFA